MDIISTIITTQNNEIQVQVQKRISDNMLILLTSVSVKNILKCFVM